MLELILEKYTVQSTGADGGHHYIKTEIDYKGKSRKLIVMFTDKTDELHLKENTQIRVKGRIHDNGEQYDLVMRTAEIN